MSILVTLYLAIAALATAWAYYGGVINRRPVLLFTVAEQVVLALTAVVAGLLWPLGLPGLLVVAVRHLRGHAANGPGWFHQTRAARVRS